MLSHTALTWIPGDEISRFVRAPTGRKHQAVLWLIRHVAPQTPLIKDRHNIGGKVTANVDIAIGSHRAIRDADSDQEQQKNGRWHVDF